MLWFMAMASLIAFTFTLILGFVFGLVTGSWRLFVVSACAVVCIWILLTMEDR